MAITLPKTAVRMVCAAKAAVLSRAASVAATWVWPKPHSASAAIRAIERHDTEMATISFGPINML
ncbi:hypothetical protein D3C72_1010720 [compost metagenome]